MYHPKTFLASPKIHEQFLKKRILVHRNKSLLNSFQREIPCSVDLLNASQMFHVELHLGSVFELYVSIIGVCNEVQIIDPGLEHQLTQRHPQSCVISQASSAAETTDRRPPAF